MKALHVIPAVAARYGGPTTAALGLCRALGQHGVDVTLATTDADGPDRLPVALGTPVMHDGVRTMFFSRTASESFKYSWRLPSWLRRAIPRMDVVHIHGVMSHACVSAARLCRRYSVPYVLSPIGTLDAASLAQKSKRKQLFLELAGRRMVADAAAVHCTGDEELATLRDVFDARATLIPLGIDDEWLAQAPRSAGDRRREIVCVSRLAPRKGLELLIDAFAAVTRHGHRDWGLTLAGSGDPAYVQTLHTRAERSSAGPRIEFPGWVDGADKRGLLAGAALFALPSSHENFGLSVLEAMACATPVVVSREVQLARWVETGGAGWITALNAGDLARTLDAAMSDAAGRATRGHAARDVASQFAWRVIAGDMVQLYRRVQTATAAASMDRAPVRPEAS